MEKKKKIYLSSLKKKKKRKNNNLKECSKKWRFSLMPSDSIMKSTLQIHIKVWGVSAHHGEVFFPV